MDSDWLSMFLSFSSWIKMVLIGISVKSMFFVVIVIVWISLFS